MSTYVRPIPIDDIAQPDGAFVLAGGWCRFTHVELLQRGAAPQVVPASQVDPDTLDRLIAPRTALAGIAMDRPRLMGILNVTPDSFSDGGDHLDPDAAVEAAGKMAEDGVDILDIGGESTRPGADFVPPDQEIARTAPVITALSAAGLAPISIDTRKTDVARAALAAGAQILNDVSAMSFDQDMAHLAAESGAPICLMHAQGDPKTMQAAPSYDDVLLDVYDFLADRIAAAEAAGIQRARIIADPGIGFGKTLQHNLALLVRLSLFHGLGVPILLGASRKRFIGTIGGQEDAKARMPGSIAVALAGIQQGVQILRVHDIAETKQAVLLDRAVREGRTHGA